MKGGSIEKQIRLDWAKVELFVKMVLYCILTLRPHSLLSIEQNWLREEQPQKKNTPNFI